MLQRLFTLRWLRMVLAAILFALACFALGRWQYSRHEARSARADLIEAHYTAAPRPLADVLGEAPLTAGDEWRVVEATGIFRPPAILVKNRTNEGESGTEVLGVLDVAGGPSVLIDLGFAARRSGTAETPLPPLPSGEVTVTGWVRGYEKDRSVESGSDEVVAISAQSATQVVAGRVVGGYVIAQTPLAGLAALEKPSTGLGPHLAYAIQWWLTMWAGFAFVFVGIRKELEQEAAAGTGASDPDRPSPAPVKARKGRNTLAEEEDAEVERRLGG